MNEITRIGMDTSKHIFQLHGVDGNDQIYPRREPTRRCQWPAMVASLFGSHVAEPILASVHVRAQQKAGHMNASNRMTRTDFVNLARRWPSTYGTCWSTHPRRCALS